MAILFPVFKGISTLFSIYSNILAWKIPWTEEPGGLWSIGSQRVGLDWSGWTHTCMLLERRWGWAWLCSTTLMDCVTHPDPPFRAGTPRPWVLGIWAAKGSQLCPLLWGDLRALPKGIPVPGWGRGYKSPPPLPQPGATIATPALRGIGWGLSANCLAVGPSLSLDLPSSPPYRWHLSQGHTPVSALYSALHLGHYLGTLRQTGRSPEKIFSGLLRTSVLWLVWWTYIKCFPGKPSLFSNWSSSFWKLSFPVTPVTLFITGSVCNSTFYFILFIFKFLFLLYFTLQYCIGITPLSASSSPK